MMPKKTEGGRKPLLKVSIRHSTVILAINECSRWAHDSHAECQRDDEGVATAEMTIHAEQEVAGYEAIGHAIQENARGNRADGEHERQSEIHGHPLVLAAARLLGVSVALLHVSGRRIHHIRLVHLGGHDVVDSEREVDERHELEDQVEEGSIATEIAVRFNPSVALDAPDEEPRHEHQHYEEDSEEHVMRPRPSPGAQEEQEEGSSDSRGQSVHNFNTVRAEYSVQLWINVLRVNRDLSPYNVFGWEVLEHDADDHPNQVHRVILRVGHLLLRVSLYGSEGTEEN